MPIANPSSRKAKRCGIGQFSSLFQGKALSPSSSPILAKCEQSFACLFEPIPFGMGLDLRDPILIGLVATLDPDQSAEVEFRLKAKLMESLKMLAGTPALVEGRVRQARVGLAVVIIVIAMFVLINDAGWQNSLLASGFTALLFLPSFIAGMRLLEDRWGIFVCNILMLGSLLLSADIGPLFLLSLLGVGLAWVATMIWSLGTALQVWLSVLSHPR